MKVVLYVIIALYDNTQITVANANTWYWDDKTGMLNVYNVYNEIVLSTRQEEVLNVIRADGDDELQRLSNFLDNLYKK